MSSPAKEESDDEGHEKWFKIQDAFEKWFKIQDAFEFLISLFVIELFHS